MGGNLLGRAGRGGLRRRVCRGNSGESRMFVGMGARLGELGRSRFLERFEMGVACGGWGDWSNELRELGRGSGVS